MKPSIRVSNNGIENENEIDIFCEIPSNIYGIKFQWTANDIMVSY